MLTPIFSLLLTICTVFILAWVSKAIYRNMPKHNWRAAFWYKLAVWAAANGDAAKHREHRYNAYTVVFQDRAESEDPRMPAWGEN